MRRQVGSDRMGAPCVADTQELPGTAAGTGVAPCLRITSFRRSGLRFPKPSTLERPQALLTAPLYPSADELLLLAEPPFRAPTPSAAQAPLCSHRKLFLVPQQPLNPLGPFGALLCAITR